MSVVIANYNRREDLRQALLSVRRQDYPHVEVIVVDNASSDGSAGMVASEFPEVNLIASSENLGMEGYSVGFRAARGRYVFQMDNDSEIPDASLLAEIARRFREGPANLGVVATRVEETRGNPNPDVEALRRNDPRVGPLNLRHYHSGGVGFLRSALDQVGYYNRDVFLYGAERFLEIKFLAAGFAVLYYPELLMLHKGSPTARSKLFLYYTVRNGLWYLRCHATAGQQARYIPASLAYNLGQALWKREPLTYFRAVRDGLGRLPQSLRSAVRSDRPDYVARVNFIGRDIGPGKMLRAIAGRVRRAKS